MIFYIIIIIITNENFIKGILTVLRGMFVAPINKNETRKAYEGQKK